MKTKPITVKTSIKSPIEKVWDAFTKPEHVMCWNNASPDWHTPEAKNDLKVGGKFDYRMEAKDGSAGFNFTGTYDAVVPNREIAYTMDDGRKARIAFEEKKGSVAVTTAFDPESENPIEMQRAGWQAILDSFKKYVESI